MPATNQPGQDRSGSSANESLLSQFESAWQRGETPAIGEYLDRVGSERATALVELLHVDLERRLKRGEAVRVEHYLDRYAELKSNPVAVVGLIRAEYDLRRRCDAKLTPAEYHRRFPQWWEALERKLPMNESHPSLLHRLQQAGDQAAWERLVDLHSALLYLWACRAGLRGNEAADLVTQVFAAVLKKLPEHGGVLPTGGFRGLLRSLAHAARRDLLLRRPVPVGGPPSPAADPGRVPAGAETLWEAEYAGFVLARAVELAQPEFPAEDWKACWEVAVEGRPAADVARVLGMTPAAVYAAEARVLSRLRQELEGLLD
jgi:RNA polymerase sigma-70 factor (ECF subfamily)